MQYLSSQYLLLPEKPGVYLFLGKNNEVLYVGKAKNLKKRVSSYFTKHSDIGTKTQVLISKIEKIDFFEVASEIESLLLEANQVKKYNPVYNTRLTDGKAYPLIRITVKSKYPAVLIARRKDDPKSIYFGPFPNAGDMRLVLRTVRRIFPFLSVLNHPKRHCLYWHLGLCPCTPVIATDKTEKDYKKTIKHIAKFLNGDIKGVLSELENEQKSAVSAEEFEKAGKIQNQIEAVEKITSTRINPTLYEENPNLDSDVLEKELEELSLILNKNGLQINSLNKIECYDISNIQGTNPTGSMVVFVSGESDKTQYRRFKIKLTRQKPDDFAMMKEVLSRRFKHTDWPYPDLIIVDGGKGQVSSALSVLNLFNIQIPLIGLAKRFETIILPDFSQVKLSHRTSSLKLLQRVRDEAHRFAVTYHRKLRKANAFL